MGIFSHILGIFTFFGSGEFANGNKSKKGTFTGNYTARSYWDSFADLHAMPKTDYFPHDNTTLAVKDQQRIQQACERSKPPAVPCLADGALSRQTALR